MSRHGIDVQVRGPWSLSTSRTFWEGFAPAALPRHQRAEELRTVFRCERDGHRADVVVTQHGATAHLAVTGGGDLDAAAAQGPSRGTGGAGRSGRHDWFCSARSCRNRGIRPAPKS